MKLESYGNSDIGRQRRRNEDAFLVDPSHQLYAVADGLGGLAGGDRASRLAVTLLKAHQRKATRAGRPLDFGQAFADAHRAIQKMGFEIDPVRGVGTTLTAAHIDGGKIMLTHAGDSAAYLFRRDSWKKLTTDHTEAEEFRRLCPERPVPPLAEHSLTRCLGQPGSMMPDILGHPIEVGDCLFLCTDGVTRDIKPEELYQWSRNHSKPSDFAEEVIKLANRRGGGDNLTAVAIFAA